MTDIINRFAGSEPEQAILNELSIDAPWALIQAFTHWVRESGSEDERKSADYIRKQLDSFGMPYKLHRPNLYLSVPKTASVEAGSSTLRAKAPSFAVSTPPEGVSGELVYVPAAQAKDVTSLFAKDADTGAYDVEGKIVLTEGYSMPARVMDFEGRGAIAQIHINPGNNIHWGICTTIWGMPDLDSIDRIPKTTAVAINKPDGEALVQKAKAGPVQVTVHAELDQGWMPCPLIVAEIPGTEEPDRFVLVHGHLDSWDVGIGDNAVGDATLLELARVLWQHRDKLRRSVRIAWWPGHSTGRYAGSTWYSDLFALDLAENCIAQIDIDSPGCRWATDYINVSWFSEAGAFCQRAIKDVTGQDSYGERPPVAGDYSFNNIGISSFYMLLSSMPPEKAREMGYYAVGGCGGNIGWHTEDDTLELADKDNLLKDLRVYVASIGRMANADVFAFDFRAVADEFAATLERYDKAAGSRFDLSPARSEVKALKACLEQFYAAAADAAVSADVQACAPFNEAILRMARILVPINFARLGRFWHDPALPILPLPDLAPALGLSSLAKGSDLAGFTVAHLVRGQNRLIDALRRAQREASLALN